MQPNGTGNLAEEWENQGCNMFRADDCKGGVNCSMSISQDGKVLLSRGGERTTPLAHWITLLLGRGLSQQSQEGEIQKNQRYPEKKKKKTKAGATEIPRAIGCITSHTQLPSPGRGDRHEPSRQSQPLLPSQSPAPDKRKPLISPPPLL